MKKTNYYFISTYVLAASLALVLGMIIFFEKKSVLAEPRTVTITCKDGTKVSVDIQSANTSFVTACGTHGYDTPTIPQPTSSDTVNPLGDFKANPDAKGLLAAKNTKTCGSGTDNEVKVAFDFGCVGPNYCKGKIPECVLNPIVDMAFAVFRFLSAGVGLIVIGSIIVAGLQYSASRGNPQATQAAIKRISSSLVALLIFIFIFAIANYLVPGGMFL